jgi:hypothetical protein
MASAQSFNYAAQFFNKLAFNPENSARSPAPVDAKWIKLGLQCYSNPG